VFLAEDEHPMSRFRGFAAAALAAAGISVFTSGVCLAQSASPEVRAMWITRFEWPSGSEAAIKSRLDNMMQTLAAHNFNTVFFQIRGQADVLYPSPYEVWSPLINGGVDPGWDPLAYAISAAHANGIAFHAYINTHTCWQSGAKNPPPNPNHLFYAHCNAADPDRRDWLIHDSAGNPVQWHESDYVWIAPGVPAAQAYTRQQVLYVVENYDVDGVHFDRIRTPNSNFSYDPISQARRADPQSNPDNLDFSHWTRDQITRQVRDIYAAVMAVKPHVQVSAAVFPDPNTSPANQHQDSLVWAQTGGLDLLVPMMYSSGAAGTTWDTRLQAWLAGSGGRHVVAGQITSVGVNMLIEQINLTRQRGAQGNSVFSWNSFTFWIDYLNNVYQVPVDPPVMNWKQSPTTAIIHGYVKDPTELPIVDAQVTRNGSPYVGLSSGDGFYSLLLVPPGTYTLQASHPAHGSASLPDVTVAAGQVVGYDITLGLPLPPVIAPVSPDPDSVTVGLEYTRQLTLTQGSADSWLLLAGPPGAAINAFGAVSGWTPGDADVGQSFAFIVRAANAEGSDDATWQVEVVPRPPCTIVPLTGFEAYDNGARVLFQHPRYSGTTSSHLAESPNIAGVTDDVAAFKGSKSYEVQWQWVDTSPNRWMRLTTHNVPSLPNPTVALDRPIRFRLRVDAGRFRLCIGMRETGTDADYGEDGGTTGSIEWIGATSVVGGVPQGVLVEAMPGVWQTFTIDPLTDPVLSFTGDGNLTSPTGKGTFEHIAFSMVDTAGPITVYIDEVYSLCWSEPFGDFNGDGYVDLEDLVLFGQCRSGPTIPFLPGCEPADVDQDGDVDHDDFAAFQRCYSGAGPQLDPACAR
jgi:uncharacterized lipoprotein YddW (UPF0748 family)